MSTGYTRGKLLGLTTVGLGAGIGGVIAAPAAAYLLAPAAKEATFRPGSARNSARPVRLTACGVNGG